MKNNCKIISLLPVAMLTLKCIAYSDTPMLFDSNSPCYNLKEMERDYVIKDTDFIVTYYTGYSYNNVISPINYLLLFKNPLGDDPTLSSSTSVQFKWTDFKEFSPSYSSTKRLEPVYDSSESIAITAYSSNNSRINNSSSIYLTNSFLALNNSDSTINAGGGAIYNTGTIHSEFGLIEKIKPIYFIGNNTSGNNSVGGAIYNHRDGNIDNLKANFIANYVSGLYSQGGGAIYNRGGFSITGDFIGNYVFNRSGRGGAICNVGVIKGISGNFINNYVCNTWGTNRIGGGAVYNAQENHIYEIVGNFIGNYIYQYRGIAYGGAIYNEGMIVDYNRDAITGNFIGNHIDSASEAYGGAIYNKHDYIFGISGNFTGNYIYEVSKRAYGGAISNEGTITTIKGDFTGNYILGNAYIYGGAIYNSTQINSITGDFIGNYISGMGHSLYGGAIYNYATINSVHGDFKDNHILVKSGEGYGGAIWNNTAIDSVHGDFKDNHILAESGEGYGGAIWNGRQITLNNSAFINNYVTASDEYNSYAQGGAIYNLGTLTINVNESITSKGNYAEVNGTKDDANGGFLYMIDGSTANFNITSSYTIGDGTKGYDSIASATSNSVINKGGSGDLTVNSSMEFFTGTLNVNAGNLNINNNLGASSINISNAASITAKINGNTVFSNSELSFSNSGILNLVAAKNLNEGSYDVFASDLSEMNLGSVKTYGGNFDSASGKFIVNKLQYMKIDEENPITVESNGRVFASTDESSDTSILMNFSSENDVIVNSIMNTSSTDEEFNAIIDSIGSENVLLAESYAFDVMNLDVEDTVNLSFAIGAGYDISLFQIYHKESGGSWELADVLDLEYDGECLSFIVDGFSSYGYIAAVPEPSTYAAIFGVLAIAFAVYSRRR